MWWRRNDLDYVDDKLTLGGLAVEDAAKRHGTPLYLYNPARVRDNLERLSGALASTGLRTRVFYALKANRHIPLLREMLEWELCGLDVCSPGELLLAREIGFGEDQISFTGAGVSSHDLDVIARHPRIAVNCDTKSAIRQLGRRSVGREIGIRINTGRGIGYRDNPLLAYSGRATTKFGIYRGEFEAALDLAREQELRVVGLHLHHGCGYLTPQLPLLEEILQRARWFADQLDDLRYINVGGGLGIPLVEDDQPLDLAAWADVLERQLGSLETEVWVEPGDYLIKDAGVLLLEVNSVERKQDVEFAYVNGGFNIHLEPAFYNLPLQVAPCHRPRKAEQRIFTVAGNINESLDIFATDISLPPIAEGDFLALLNAGGYGSSMASNHCLRGQFNERLTTDEHRFTAGAVGPENVESSELSRRNIRAWDTLYGQSQLSVWGREPLAFLGAFIAETQPRIGSQGLVLDAGAGEGRNLDLLLETGATVYACDSSRNAIGKTPRSLRDRVRTFCCDLTALPLASQSLDFVLLFDVLETLPIAESVLREIGRALAPGGQLLCNIPDRDDGIADVEMDPLSGDGFLYQQRYYYNFRGRQESCSLLSSCGYEIRVEQRCRWTEEPHPGFREQEHWHESWVFLASKVS